MGRNKIPQLPLDDQCSACGVQFIGDCFKEKNLIRAGFAYEQARGKFE